MRTCPTSCLDKITDWGVIEIRQTQSIINLNHTLMASTIPVAVGEARLKHKTQGGDLNQKNLNYDIQTH